MYYYDDGPIDRGVPRYHCSIAWHWQLAANSDRIIQFHNGRYSVIKSRSGITYLELTAEEEKDFLMQSLASVLVHHELFTNPPNSKKDE